MAFVNSVAVFPALHVLQDRWVVVSSRRIFVVAIYATPLLQTHLQGIISKLVIAYESSAPVASPWSASILQLGHACTAVGILLVLPFLGSEVLFEANQSTWPMTFRLGCVFLFNGFPVDVLALQMFQQQ